LSPDATLARFGRNLGDHPITTPPERAELAQKFDYAVAGIGVLPFDEAAARLFARRNVKLEVCRLPLAEADLRIAAIARPPNLTLTTGNLRHFGRLPGLIVEDWLGTR
jgi:tRNA(fMet)-specific endonuclease VapC